MAQIDQTPIYCKVDNFDVNFKGAQLFLYEPPLHWADESAPICVGEFEVSSLGEHVSAGPIALKNGLVLQDHIGKDDSDAQKPIFWLPTWNLSLASNQADPCLSTQINPQILGALRRDKPKVNRRNAWTKVQSSSIDFVRYVDTGWSCYMEVVFHGNKNGGYRYDGISHWDYQDMLKAPSVGTFFSQKVKGAFECEKFEFNAFNPGPY